MAHAGRVKVLDQAHGANWTLYHGDAVETLPGWPANSLHLPIFSPPFLDLYTYSATERDLGNSRSPQQFWRHFAFVRDELMRATVPGRLCCVHVAQVPSLQSRHGVIGLIDFRGQTIRAFQRGGWIYHGETAIDKDPQAQAIRTHSKSLLFTQLRKDASWMRPALADYLLLFRKPGENPVPVRPDVTNDEWIEWARPIWRVPDTADDVAALEAMDAIDLVPSGPLFWYGVRESDTLNVAEGRDDDDERHVCPLQLGTIRRAVRLWTNEGEAVASVFAGIGSEGYEAIRLGRRFVGVELKRRYFEAAVKNLQRAEAARSAGDLFSAHGIAV